MFARYGADRERLAVDMRVTARQLFEHALAEAGIDRAFQRHVYCERGVLRICEDLYDLDSYSRVLVISIGKAAQTLVNSLEMQAGPRFEGIVASSVEPVSQARGFRYFRGGHPTPNQESVRAAEAMLKSLSGQNASSLVIFMLSGGGSSMAEKPINDEISLEDLVTTHRALEETPKSDDPAFHRCRWWTLLSNASVVEASKVEAQRLGFTVEVDNSCDDWDYARAAEYLLNRLRELRKKSERVCLISGGEVTVKVTNGGVGGRNQQFVLACSQKIAGQNITVLSAGTDGIDGNSPAAGAVVDGTTLERAKARGLDAEAHLTSFNAHPFFEALGDAIVTGPTGNNLRDLRILLAY